jgi:hypothetical protein
MASSQSVIAAQAQLMALAMTASMGFHRYREERLRQSDL